MELVCNREYRECQDWPQWPVWEVPAYRLPGEDKRTDPAPSLELNLTVYQARVYLGAPQRAGLARGTAATGD